jgi:RNA polymerase sigma-B factor
MAERPRSAPATPIDRARRQREDQRLMRLVQKGDERAREELIERYMPLARSLALRYRRASEPLDDLIQVASVGLVKAVDRWDPERGLAFSSYAVPTILGELRRHFRDRTWIIHLSRGTQEAIARVERATEELRQRLGRFPSAEEVAKAARMTAEEVMDARLAEGASRLASLDASPPRDDPGEGTLRDVLGRSDGDIARVEDALWIEQIAGALTEREREVLRLRFVEDLVQREIAERVGVSQMHVSRILRDALSRLAAVA